MRVLRGADLRSFHGDMMSLWAGEVPESCPQAATRLRVHTRRTVLDVAMLLSDSDSDTDIVRIDGRMDELARNLRDLSRRGSKQR
ncbi:hypothetical protein ACFV8E_00890 [Streptomyces sp. NPDC059849]|uniref:hypothetical protein n=1 Tax=Streptomyces sp. NPDC059849 TaxID=3346969 RepID=UPI0036467384